MRYAALPFAAALFAAALFAAAAPLATAQEEPPAESDGPQEAPADNDDLFDDDLFNGLFDTAEDFEAPDPNDDPNGDTQPRGDLLSRFEDPDTVRLRSTITATGGVGYGWTRWPEPEAPWRHQRATAEFTSGFRFTFDARPDPVLRVFGSLSTEIDPAERKYQWTTVTIDELFFDYTLQDFIFVRAGQHKMKWGQGRIFTPGNLMDESEKGLAVRVNMPTVLDGISLVTLGQDDFFRDRPNSPRYLAYAGQASLVAGPVLFTAGARYQDAESLRALGSVKTVIRATDLFTDVVVSYDHRTDDVAVQTVSGFYREWGDWRFYGEHSFDGTSGRDDDHSAGLAFARRRIFGTRLNFATLWEHAFVDHSGTVVPGISWSPWRLVTARLGLPVTYGADNSRYVQDNEDPANRRLAAIFQLQLSASF
ncbi:MAG: hypothetical protein EA403_10725 [Spirochaetaceae bacterium]|nr:MAG: hypothetical protein EA403_10725 [Spirochaetaceae bacterium]